MVENEYAKALYEIAQENKKEEQYRDYFRILMTLYFEDEDFKKLLNSPLMRISLISYMLLLIIIEHISL